MAPTAAGGERAVRRSRQLARSRRSRRAGGAARGGVDAPAVRQAAGPFVCDLKTGPATLKYGALKVAMQLAVYARSNLYNPETGRRQPHSARTDKGLVIALDSDTAQVGLHITGFVYSLRHFDVSILEHSQLHSAAVIKRRLYRRYTRKRYMIFIVH